MRRSTVGGYQGPVIVLNSAGEEVANAACRYRAEEGGRGEDHSKGQWHRVAPPGAVLAGVFRLRLPDGEEGDVTVREVVSTSDTIVYFDGIGRRPR